MDNEKILLNVPETMAYLGLGRKQTMELMREEPFGCKIGARLYANRRLLDRWLEQKCKRCC